MLFERKSRRATCTAQRSVGRRRAAQLHSDFALNHPDALDLASCLALCAFIMFPNDMIRSQHLLHAAWFATISQAAQHDD